MKPYNKILLVNFGGIGDEILFMPVISSLKKKYPRAEITLCLESRSKAFLSLTDLVDKSFFVDIKTKNKYLEMIKLYFHALFGGYDIVISSGSNPLISVLLFFTGIKTRVGYGVSAISKTLLTHPVELNKNQYAGMMYYDLVKDITNLPFELPSIKVADCEQRAEDPFNASNQEADCEKEKNSVLVHPGVSKISRQKGIVKTVGPQAWGEIIKGLLKKGKRVYLAGGNEDRDCTDEILKYLEKEDLTNFTDLAGKTKNIYDLAVLIKKAEILVCSDSAPMHIGVAVNTKTYAIFGPTDDKVLLPDSSNFTAIKNDIECRPCLWEKRQTTCEKLDCLKFNIDEVVNIIK